MRDDSLACQFCILRSTTMKVISRFFTSGNSKGFVWDCGYGLSEFVYCFVDLGSNLGLASFLEIWNVIFSWYTGLFGFSYIPFNIDNKSELWWHCLYRWFLWGSVHCGIDRLKLPIIAFPCWNSYGLGKVKSIEPVLSHLVLNYFRKFVLRLNSGCLADFQLSYLYCLFCSSLREHDGY